MHHNTTNNMSQELSLQEIKAIERKALLVPNLRNRGKFAFKDNKSSQSGLKNGYHQLRDGRTIYLKDLEIVDTGKEQQHIAANHNTDSTGIGANEEE